jgi:hypothetical protein
MNRCAISAKVPDAEANDFLFAVAAVSIGAKYASIQFPQLLMSGAQTSRQDQMMITSILGYTSRGSVVS